MLGQPTEWMLTMNPALKKLGRPRDPALAERRKEEILALATKIFADQGFRNTDVQTISDALGVGKGTVYRYFPSKRDLFCKAVDRAMTLLMDHLIGEADKSQEPLQRLENVIRAYLIFFDENPEIVELIVQERAEFRDREKPTYFVHCDVGKTRWLEAFRNLIAKGISREIPEDRMFDVISNLLYGTMFTNFFNGHEKSCEDQAREIIDIFYNGILKKRVGDAPD